MKTLYVVLKLSERCNLNCSYCYYFNGLDKSFESKPPLLKTKVVKKVIDFLLQGIIDYKIESLGITLHGGEPMLVKRSSFDKMCTELREALEPKLKKFTLLLQTNGTLIDVEWIKLFEKHQIKLGISIDGVKENHDQYRVDHKGKGSYNKIMQSITLLNDKNYDFGVLSVIDPTYSAKEIFDRFIIPYEITGMDFLWPDFTHDIPAPYPARMYGKYIVELFNYWINHGDPNLKIRFFNSNLNLLLGGRGLIYGQGIENSKDSMHVISIRSDGEVVPTDELMSTDPEIFSTTGRTVFNTSLKEIFNLPVFSILSKAISTPPQKCQTCCWQISCGGGNITNRYSKAGEFDNPSVYCDGLKLFYSNILSHLLSNGIDPKEIAENLKLRI